MTNESELPYTFFAIESRKPATLFPAVLKFSHSYIRYIFCNKIFFSILKKIFAIMLCYDFKFISSHIA